MSRRLRLLIITAFCVSFFFLVMQDIKDVPLKLLEKLPKYSVGALMKLVLLHIYIYMYIYIEYIYYFFFFVFFFFFFICFLFRTLLDLNCEDVILELVLK